MDNTYRHRLDKYRFIHRCYTEPNRISIKKIPLVGVIIFSLWFSLFSSPRAIREPMVENTVETATIVPTTQNSISTEKKVLEEVIPTEMSKPIQTLEPSKPSIKEGIVEISYEISSDELSKLFDGELEETIVIVVPECSPSCTASEIDEALGPASSTDGTWVGVLVGNTLYIHSGWNPIQGPWPGDIFRRLSKFDSDVTLCLGDLCYHMEDYVQLSRDQVGEGIYLSNFFKDIEETDLFVVTCDYGFSIGRGDYSPKILVHLKTINSE